MHKYLTRVHWLDGRHNFSGHVNSEMFLRRVGKLSGIRFRVQASWMFCKFAGPFEPHEAHRSRCGPNADRPSPAHRFGNPESCWYRAMKERQLRLNDAFPNAWPDCTFRIRERRQCTSFVCDWCGKGCRCFSPNCTERAERKRRCTMSYANKTAARAAGRVMPSAGVSAAGQLLLQRGRAPCGRRGTS